MAANARAETAVGAVRDKPIPKSAAEVKHDFIETRGKVKTAWNTVGTDKVISDAARQRLEALIAAWKMSHTQEPDYAVILSNFEAEVQGLKGKIRKSWMMVLGTLAALYSVMGLIALCN